MTERPIRLLDIAAKAGVSRTTVSMALNDHPRISDATKEHVPKIAAESGYRIDPVARALGQKKSGGSKPVYLGTLAFLEDPEMHAFKTAHPQFKKKWDDQFEQVCRGMGYRLDCFVVGSTERQQRSLNRILKARGIKGLIINGFNKEIHQWKLDWGDFAAVIYSGSLHEHFVHNVTSSSYQDAYDAMLRLCEKNYQRPGCFVRPRFDHWSAGFSSAMENWGHGDRIPKLILDGTIDDVLERDKFFRWYDQYEPDVIVANLSDQLVHLLAEKGVHAGDEVGYLCLDIPLDKEWLSGLVQKRSAAFQVLVDLLHSMLMRHEFGTPTHPFCVQIPSRWNEGKTLR